jgi:hypothetical protein
MAMPIALDQGKFGRMWLPLMLLSNDFAFGRGIAMAKIWPVYEGSQPTSGWPWADLPLSTAIDLFKLQPRHFVSDLDTIPRFGPVNRDLWFAGFKHIVVEVEPAEARRAGWKPGRYLSPISPKDGFGKLIQEALVAKLGDNNVERLQWEPATDSQGREALKITVVIPPGAVSKLEKGSAVLDALVSLQKRLNEMRDHRTPILEYATEAELKQDGGRKSRPSA